MSLLPLLERDDRTDFGYSIRDKKPDRTISVRSRQHHLIYDFVTEQREFFDLERDPHETRNLSPSSTDAEEALAAAMVRFTMQRTLAKPPPTGTALDEDLRERLRALGYLE